MRILIVDDEMVSRTKLATLMDDKGACQTADCGTSAITQYEQAMTEGKPFDLVMLDIDMPDMQGHDVLRQMRKVENFGPHRATVVMVTAQSDKNHVLACMKYGCDEYIAKPFNALIIEEKLKNLGLVKEENVGFSSGSAPDTEKMSDKIFMEVFNALRSGKIKLPVMPQVAIEFRALVQNSADREQMAELLKQDITLSANLIQVANSVLYRGFGLVKSVQHAITRLGLTETEKMVTALSHRQLFNTVHRKYKDALYHLWQHSLASGYAAECITSSLQLSLPIDAFCAGLFHDIGGLALLSIIAEMETLGRYKDEIDAEAINDTLETYHAMFGAKLLEMWGFDTTFTNTTLSHNRLYTAAVVTDELVVVHLANLMAKSLGYTADGQPHEVDLMASESAKSLNLDEAKVAVLKQEVSDRMVASADLMN